MATPFQSFRGAKISSSLLYVSMIPSLTPWVIFSIWQTPETAETLAQEELVVAVEMLVQETAVSPNRTLAIPT